MPSRRASLSTAGRSFASWSATTSAWCARSTRSISRSRPSPPFQMFQVRTRTRPRALLLAREVVGRLRAAAVAALALAEEARELGGDRLAGDVVSRDLVGALLELLDIRRGLLVGGDGLAHLLRVLVRGGLELARVDRGAEQRAKPIAERECRARARRERHVMRNRGPQTDGGNSAAVEGVVKDA